MAKLFYDTIIIGAGVVGFASAMYSGRLGLKTLVIGDEIGGTANFDYEVKNYPGFISIKGSELFKKIEEHAHKYHPQVLKEIVEKISAYKKGNKTYYEVFTNKQSFLTKTIIIATGAEQKKLEIPGEKEFMHRGVHSCALCDATFYKNKIVAVVGGSDSAAKEALVLSEHAKKVYIIYRGDKIHPEPIKLRKIKDKRNIEIINNTNVVEIKGNKFVNKIILDKPYNGSTEFKLDGVFIGIGHAPLSELVKPIKVKTNKKEEIVVNRNSETNVKGVYAAGDVTDIELKQIITGIGQGVTAAYYAYKYINENKFALNP